MATISGSLRFDRDRTSLSSPALPGIANIPIVLQNTATNEMLAVYTQSDGSYQFTNVPDGSYRIVEAYGMPAVASPGDFSTAAPGVPVTAAFPPLSVVNNPPAGSTNLDATTPTTLLVTVAGADLVNQDFLNGPVQYTPIDTIMDNNVTVFPANLITNADNGSFGSFPPGTAANTGAGPTPPYPEINSQFTYATPSTTTVVPLDGEYTVQNLMTDAVPQSGNNTWWRVADHTTGNETGRMMPVNGFTPGSIFFEQKVDVKPLTYYLFSTWIANLSKSTGITEPKLGVEVLAQDGTTLFKATLGEQIPMDPNSPEWRQIGTLIDTKTNTSLTVRFTSEGPAEMGNDYIIDDVQLQEIKVAVYDPQKSASPTAVRPGETTTYTITLPNTGKLPLTQVSVKDAVPAGFTFVPGSVTVDGIADVTADPNIGFTVPDIAGGATLTVTFSAVANQVPAVNPASNTAGIHYLYTPVVGGIANWFDLTTNPALVTVINPVSADLSVTKTADKTIVKQGDILIYTLTVTNQGPDNAQTVTLTDTIPADLTGAEYSADGGVTWAAWSGTLPLGTVANGASHTLLIRGTVSPAAGSIIVNTAQVESPTPDPLPANNSSVVDTPVSPLSADLSVTKTGGQTPVQGGDLLTYTILVANNGPDAAQSVVLSDPISADLTVMEYSADGGASWQPWTGTLPLGTIANGTGRTIMIRGIVSPSAGSVIVNTASADSPTPDPIPGNNSSMVNTPVTPQTVPAADLAITKTTSQTSVRTGELLTYTLNVTNQGPSAAESVTLTDPLSADLTGTEYSTDGGATWQPFTGTLSLGTVTNGTTLSVQIRGTVSSAAGTILTNTAVVESTTPDPVPGNNSAVVDTPVAAPSADLLITKTTAQTAVSGGDLLTYTILVTNNGPDAAQSVLFSDPLPASLTAPQYSIDGGATWASWGGTLPLGTMASGTAIPIQIRGTVSPTAGSVIVNTAFVESPTPDPVPTNNSAVMNTPVTPVLTSADLMITKTSGQNTVSIGNLLTYTINVTNNGPNDALSVMLTDPIPADLTGPEYSTDGGTTWLSFTGTLPLGTIASGAAIPIQIRGTVGPTPGSVIVNTALVESLTPDPVPGNNSALVTTPVTAPLADLSVSKTTAQTAVLPGDVLTYTLSVTNNGPSDALSVILVDPISADVTIPEYSADGGVTWLPFTGTLPLGTITSGTTIPVQIRGTVSLTAGSVIGNTAIVESPTPDPVPGNNSSTVNTPVTPLVPTLLSADLAVTKTTAQTTAQIGSLLNYTLTVTNNGPDDATSVILTDPVSVNLTGPEYSADGGATWLPWPGLLPLGTVANGASTTIQIRGTVSPSANGIIINAATAVSLIPDPVPANNSSLVSTPLAPLSADLMITKTGGSATVQSGDLLTYTINVTNNGPNDAQSVLLTDALPAGLTGAEYSTDGGVTWLPWSGTLPLGTVATGASRPVQIRGTVSPTAGSVMINTAIAESPTPDPVPGNNSSMVNTPVTPPAPLSADLSVTKTTAQTAVRNGDILTYTLTVTNNGPDAAQTVVLTDLLSNDLTGAEYSTDGGTTWQAWGGTLPLGTMASGASSSVQLRGTVSPTADSVIVNTAEVESPTPDPIPVNNSSLVNTPLIPLSADLAVTKVSGQTSVQSGDTLTYTVTVSNSGPDAAQSVLLTDLVSADLTGVEYTTDGGVTWLPWSGTLPLGTIAAGTDQSLQIRGTVSPVAGSIVINTATAESTTPDPNPSNNSSMINIPVLPPAPLSADLSVTKTSGQTSVQNGDLITYTIQVTNSGPDASESVLLTDPITSDILGAEYSGDNGVTWLPWTGTLPLGTITGGTSRLVQIRGTVSPTAIGMIVNTAIAESPTPDPRPGNNSSMVNTPITPPSADLMITKTTRQSTVQNGDTLTYSIHVTNLGPDAATDVILSDPLTVDLTGMEYSVNGLTWQSWNGALPLGTMANGASADLQLRGIVGAASGSIVVNTAIAESSTPDPRPGNNSSVVNTPVINNPVTPPSADLAIRKTAWQSTVQGGRLLTYTIQVTNNGPDAAESVTLSDPSPAALTGMEYSANGGTTWQAWSGSLSLGTMERRTSQSVLIRGTLSPTASGTVENRANVESPTPDPHPGNNTSVVRIPIIPAIPPSADLAITKTSGQSAVRNGAVMNYNIYITNYGPGDAQSVILADPIPPQLMQVEYSPDGIAWQPFTGSCPVGTIAGGSTAVVFIRGTVSPSANGIITNTARVESPTPDPRPGNNHHTLITPIIPSNGLTIVKTAYPQTVSPHASVTYTLSVSNQGPCEVSDVVVNDPMPDDICSAIYSMDHGKTWRTWRGMVPLGTLPPCSRKIILIKGAVGDCRTREITNCAWISSSHCTHNQGETRSRATIQVRQDSCGCESSIFDKPASGNHASDCDCRAGKNSCNP